MFLRCRTQFLPWPLSFPQTDFVLIVPYQNTHLSNDTFALNLHRWNICANAYEKGRREGVRVNQFLREPIVRRFGEEFYDQMCAAAEHILSL